jgi:hypothetical protein
VLELTPETFALLRQAHQALDEAHGARLSDDQLVAALCNAALDDAPGQEPTGRAKFQVAVTICEGCKQGWQEGAGAQIAISPAAVERTLCDAQHIGSLDAATPERAYQDISPSVARLVWRRDGGRCRVPGCRSTRGLELHHLVHRADGGGHEASNIILTCSGCHQSHHDGVLAISGTADRLRVSRPDGMDARAERRAHVCAPTLAPPAPMQADAKAALVTLGWRPAIAKGAVTAAAATLGSQTTLERLIFEALRRCPRPST